MRKPANPNIGIAFPLVLREGRLATTSTGRATSRDDFGAYESPVQTAQATEEVVRSSCQRILGTEIGTDFFMGARGIGGGGVFEPVITENLALYATLAGIAVAQQEPRFELLAVSASEVLYESTPAVVVHLSGRVKPLGRASTIDIMRSAHVVE